MVWLGELGRNTYVHKQNTYVYKQNTKYETFTSSGRNI